MLKPILFNKPMVQALLEHRKTTTRRIIKPKDSQILRPPYSPEDILWVRETWTQTPDGTYWYKADNLCTIISSCFFPNIYLVFFITSLIEYILFLGLIYFSLLFNLLFSFISYKIII